MDFLVRMRAIEPIPLPMEELGPGAVAREPDKVG